jgi:hypothetical protein
LALICVSDAIIGPEGSSVKKEKEKEEEKSERERGTGH